MNNLIGQIKCSEIIEQSNGTYKVTFDYDEKFKSEYKRLFGLKKWSTKHFEKMLEQAIINFTNQSKEDTDGN